MKSSKALIRNFFPLDLRVAILVFLLTACGGNQTSTPQSPVTSDSSETTQSSTTTTEGKVIEVKLSEFKIDMPSSLPSGTIAFQVTNIGKVQHNFAIEGSGIKQEFESDLAPGTTETLQVNLKPGTYQVYCSVGNHKRQGMVKAVTVAQQK